MAVMLNVGVDPDLIGDPSFPGAAMPNVDAAAVRAGLEATRMAVAKIGLEYENCFVDLGETAEATLRASLTEKHYDIIMVGAGVRLNPPLTPLFELVMNCIAEFAPTSRVCFNTGPDTSVDAVQRWWHPPRNTETL